MRFKVSLVLLILGAAHLSITAQELIMDRKPDLVEPAKSDEAIAFVYFTMSGGVRLDPGPSAALFVQTDPFISQRLTAQKNGALFYVGNLKVGRTYRFYQYADFGYSLSGKTIFTYDIGDGIAGKDDFTVTVDHPGVYFLGAFKRAADKSVSRIDSPTEKELLSQLSGILGRKPSWKALVDSRLKELK